MKQVLVNNGGHPFTTRDLEYLNSNQFDVLKAFGKGLKNFAHVNVPYLLQEDFAALQVTNTISTTTLEDGGWIVWPDGEPIMFEIQTITNESSTKVLVLERQTVYHSSNPMIYSDASSHNVHQDKRLVLKYVTGGPESADQVLVSDILTLAQVLRLIVGNPSYADRSLNFAIPSWALGSLDGTYDYYNSDTRTLTLVGEIANNTSVLKTGWQVIGTYTTSKGITGYTCFASAVCVVNSTGFPKLAAIKLDFSGTSVTISVYVDGGIAQYDYISLNGVKVNVVG